ncbi:MAG: HlyC/CorC family transporter [Phycisphaerales bacterium]|nr:HlyC/CorC family transporter [Phycisphaerales bacterium]
MNAGWWLILGLTFASVAGLFASLTLSLYTLSRIRISSRVQDSDHESTNTRVLAILEDVQGHAVAIAFLKSVFRFATAVALVYWTTTMRELATPDTVSMVLGLIATIIVLWVSSTLVPMGVANHAGERVVIQMSGIIRLAHMIFVPVLPLWRFINEVVRRLSGADLNSKDLAISGSDLRAIVVDSEVENNLDEVERDMLEAVVEFRSTSVEQIMTPRTEINALEYTDDLGEVQAFINEHGHSRHPVYSENLDHIEGMLYAKDLLKWIINHGNNGKPFVLSELLREPSFVPETKTVRELLTQLLADQVHIAIILDEYGGTSGLVTMEDIVEEIFGEIQDEYEEPEDATAVVLDQSNKSAEIDARTEIDDANDELGAVGIELPESDDYDTVGGFINTLLGRIPEQGEEFDHESLRFEILEAEPTRVVRLRVLCVPDQDEPIKEQG